MNFAEALGELKLGRAVARKGWNGKGMCIYEVKGTIIPVGDLRNEALKHVGMKRSSSDIVRVNSHIDMLAADGSIVVGWLASQTDMSAEDWEIV